MHAYTDISSLFYLRFCERVLDGKLKLHSIDWWSGLYDQNLAKPGKFKPGFLRSKFLQKARNICGTLLHTLMYA